MDRLDRIEKLLEDSIRERKEAQQENAVGMKELKEAQRENAIGMKELRESQKETDEQMKQGFKELRESQKETSAQIQETRESIKELRESQKETDEMLKRLSKKMNSFLGNYGEVAEEYFYRSLEDKMTLGGIKFDEIDRRVRYDSHSIEFDIMLYNGESVGIVEVKSKVHPGEIKSLTQSKVAGFKKDYPEQSQKKIYFGIASMVTNPPMIEEARKNQIFLMTQKGDHLEVINDQVKAY